MVLRVVYDDYNNEHGIQENGRWQLGMSWGFNSLHRSWYITCSCGCYVEELV